MLINEVVKSFVEQKMGLPVWGTVLKCTETGKVSVRNGMTLIEACERASETGHAGYRATVIFEYAAMENGEVFVP